VITALTQGLPVGNGNLVREDHAGERVLRSGIGVERLRVVCMNETVRDYSRVNIDLASR
jgi:hypothetical protein